jgi:hypothetical protein
MPKSGAITIIRQSAPFRNAVGPSFLKIFLRDKMQLLHTSISAAENKPAEEITRVAEKRQCVSVRKASELIELLYPDQDVKFFKKI